MHPLPRHWAVHRETVLIPGRGELDLQVHGWSVDSPQEAEARARDRWQELVDRGGPRPRTDAPGAPGEYYPDRHLPESVLEEIPGRDGDLLAVLTRNRYGAEVLNADLLLICDIDFPADVVAAAGRRRGLLSRLIGGATAAASAEAHATGLPGDGPPGRAHEEIRSRVAAVAAAHPALGVRTYRTRAGFRLLVTGADLDPASPGAAALMAELGTDPLYATLCRVHRSYRARLTPKPWRIGVPVPGPVTPWTAQERWFTDWVRAYREASAGVAVCRVLEVHGPAPSPEEALLIERHDEAVRAGSGLPLA